MMSIPSTLARAARHWWWQLAAGGVATFLLVAALDNLTQPGRPYLDQTTVALTLGVVVVVGLCLRPYRRTTGDALLALGAGPAVAIYWAWPIVVMAVLVLVFGLLDVVDARSGHDLGSRGRLITLLMITGVVAAVATTAVLVVIGDLAAFTAAGFQLVLLIVLVAAAARRPAATAVPPAPRPA